MVNSPGKYTGANSAFRTAPCVYFGSFPYRPKLMTRDSFERDRDPICIYDRTVTGREFDFSFCNTKTQRSLLPGRPTVCPFLSRHLSIRGQTISLTRSRAFASPRRSRQGRNFDRRRRKEQEKNASRAWAQDTLLEARRPRSTEKVVLDISNCA